MNVSVHSFETHLERGDLNAAAEWLVRTHGRDVLHLCAAIVRDRGTAEDLAQDAFSKAFTALPDFRGEASARTWLMTIARHRCLDHLRRSARQPWSLGREEDLREPTHASDDEALVSDLLARHADLRVGLDALDEGERAMVLLRFVHGLSFEEIATSFGVKSGAVRMRVGRALSKMRDAIEGSVPEELQQALRKPVVARTAPAPRRTSTSPTTGAPAAPAAPHPAPAIPASPPLGASQPRAPSPAPGYAGPPAGAAPPPPAMAPAPPPSAMAPGPPLSVGASGGRARDAGSSMGAFARLRARVAQAFGGSDQSAPVGSTAQPPPRTSPERPAAAGTATLTRTGGVAGNGSTLERMLGALLGTLAAGEPDDAADDAFVQRLLGDVPGRSPLE